MSGRLEVIIVLITAARLAVSIEPILKVTSTSVCIVSVTVVRSGSAMALMSSRVSLGRLWATIRFTRRRVTIKLITG
uniref:Putative secreted peptide n=1 Tax=Anopheles braziliensis TaxID=58242 RepID=A0A2M3ZW63_9DIPT